MKRKIGILLLTALLMLTLCACQPEKNVISAIDAIGKVTVESGDAIEHAETLYNELDADAQEKVTNWDVLVDARAEYNRQIELIETAAEQVEAIGEVTLNSGNAIAAARTAYDEAIQYDLLDELEEAGQTLEAAEEAYDQILTEVTAVVEGLEADLESGNYAGIVDTAAPYVESLPDGEWRTRMASVAANSIYAQAYNEYVLGELGNAKEIVDQGADFIAYCDATIATELESLTEEIHDVHAMVEKLEALVTSEKYGEVEALAAPYLSTFPAGVGRTQLGDIVVTCMVREATSQYEAGNVMDAMKILNRCADYKDYCTADTLNSAETQKATITTALSKKTPRNGAIIERTYNPGRNTFTVTAGSYDTLVKLELIDDSSKYVMVYVKANQTVKVNLLNGSYYIKYTTGPIWYDNENMFGDDATFVKLSSTMKLAGYTSGRYVYWHSVTCTLRDGYGSEYGYQNISPSKF